jgi:hypothetical protein
MLRLELTFLHLATGGGCFRWRDEHSSYLQSEPDARPKYVGLKGNVVEVMILQAAGQSPLPIQQCRLAFIPFDDPLAPTGHIVFSFERRDRESGGDPLLSKRVEIFGGDRSHLERAMENLMNVETYAPGRSAEYNQRIASRECGHALAARCLGSNVFAVTICPDADHGYEGRCTRSGPPSSLNLDDAVHDESLQVISTCELLEKLTPEIGSGRVESSEYCLRAQTNCVELLAGECAELILHPESPPLSAVHDHTEARAFAGVACASSAAVPALLEYCRAEARGLLLATSVSCARWSPRSSSAARCSARRLLFYPIRECQQLLAVHQLARLLLAQIGGAGCNGTRRAVTAD